AGRDAGVDEDLGERPRAARRPLRRLEHHGVAERERGRDFPRRDRNREIPGRDQADDSDRLARDLDVHAGTHGWHLFARKAQRLTGEELEDVTGADGLADALRQRLALFAREQAAELVL